MDEDDIQRHDQLTYQMFLIYSRNRMTEEMIQYLEAQFLFQSAAFIQRDRTKEENLHLTGTPKNR